MDALEQADDLDSPISIEAGALTLQNLEETKIPSKELWERLPRFSPEKLPTDGTPVLRFEILTARIMPPGNENLKSKRYVVYDLCVRRDTRHTMDKQPAVIQRRYTDFRKLWHTLKHSHPQDMINVDFPDKVLMGNFSVNLIAERSNAFESLLEHIARNAVLRTSPAFLVFLQDLELEQACRLLDERKDSCIPILENSFLLLNKVFMDRSRPVLLVLCRLVAACTSTPIPHQSAEQWAQIALNRYNTLCDIDLLPLYIPLLNTCAHLWWQRGRDQKPISDRLNSMAMKGINVTRVPTLTQAIHNLDPRSETV